MSIIMHNMLSQFSCRQLNINEGRKAKSVERLSSGYRINRSADDAAGLAISEKMRSQIRGLEQGSRNAQHGISVTQLADGALQEVHGILHRMEELAVQAANDTNTASDRSKIQAEIEQLEQEIDRIGHDTEFNEIKIFKSTEVPEISGSPTDMLVYHEDDGNGTPRAGGIVYNGIRYSYEEMNLNYDNDGNVVKGTYNVEVMGQNGDMIDIPLIFEGGSLVPSGREYELIPKDDGVYIDGILHAWGSMKDENGNALDVNNITEGKYSFQHVGLTFSFYTQDDMSKDSLISRLSKDGLDNYRLMSANPTISNSQITPFVSINSVTVTSASREFIPGRTNSNSGSYDMRADADGLWLSIPAQYNVAGTGEIALTKRTWGELGITDEDFMETDVGNNSGLNPDSTVTGGEVSKMYTYTDDKTGIAINFTIDSEVSKDELIEAINDDWTINVTTNNTMQFTTAGSAGVTIGSRGSVLSNYGTQYALGRTMDTNDPLVLANGADIQYDSATDELSFVMTDGNNVSYNMISSGVRANVLDDIKTGLGEYIVRYASAYKNGATGSTADSSGEASVRFVEENNPNYWVELNCALSFSGWLKDDDFTKTAITDINGNTTGYKVEYDVDTIVANLSAKINDLADEVIGKMNAATMTVETDGGPITARNTISRNLLTENLHYSSRREVGDRQMNIQVGANSYQAVQINLPAMDASILGVAGLNVMNHLSAGTAMEAVQDAVVLVNNMRSGFGASQNRLEHAVKMDDIFAENLQAAESIIRDVDMADEMVIYSKNSILTQAAESILAQANQKDANIVSLLQG